MTKTRTISSRKFIYHGILAFALHIVIASSYNGSNNNNAPYKNNNNNNNNKPAFTRGNNNNNDDNDDNDDNLSQYSLNQHISFNPEQSKINLSVETEAVAFFEKENTQQDAKFPPRPSLESRNALFCNGGDTNASLFIAMAECRFTGQSPDFDSDVEDDDESEDDDDDDDDDGHGMMLSNASFRRSLVAASGGPTRSNPSPPRSDDPRHESRSGSGGAGSVRLHESATQSHHATNRRRVINTLVPRRTRDGPSSPSVTKALSLRGGTAPSASTTFARKLLVAAIVTLGYEGVIGHLLEFVKIVMQTSAPGTTYSDVLRTITAEKGLMGIWDGFIPWGVVQAIGKGGVFGLARAVAWSHLQPLVENGTLPKTLALTIAGGIAGGFQGYVLSPTLLLKTRVMTNPVFREKMTLAKTTALSLTIGFDVVLNEGLGALMKGANVFALKRVFDWSTRFYFSDVFAKLLRSLIGKDLTAVQSIYADFLGGTASTLATLPLDVLVAKTQDAKKAGVDVSPFKMFLDELQEKGAKGLKDSYMKGFVARLLHVCFTTIAMKTGTSIVYDLLFGEKK